MHNGMNLEEPLGPYYNQGVCFRQICQGVCVKHWVKFDRFDMRCKFDGLQLAADGLPAAHLILEVSCEGDSLKFQGTAIQ